MEYIHILFEVIGAVSVGVLLGVAVDKILWKKTKGEENDNEEPFN